MRFHIEDKVIFDPDAGDLQPGDQEKIILKYNEAQLLKLLLSGLFEKNELIDKVWGKTVVTDSSYHKLVFDLRAQLEKRAGPQDRQDHSTPRRQFVGVFTLLDDAPATADNDTPPAEDAAALAEQPPPSLARRSAAPMAGFPHRPRAGRLLRRRGGAGPGGRLAFVLADPADEYPQNARWRAQPVRGGQCLPRRAQAAGKRRRRVFHQERQMHRQLSVR